jgi:hypothetical protein
MAEPNRCPHCQTTLPAVGKLAWSRCPGCGGRLQAEAEPPAAARPQIPVADVVEPTPEERRPRKRKKMRRVRNDEIEGIDFVGLGMAAGAAILLLAVSLGFGAVVHAAFGGGGQGNKAVVKSRPQDDIPLRPKDDKRPADKPGKDKPPADKPAKDQPADKGPGDKPLPKEIAWTAKPDPASKPVRPFNFPQGPGLPLNGNPLFAAKGGPFVIDTPERGLNMDSELMKKEAPLIPGVDLRTGKSVGSIPKAVPRGKQALLSPDGHYLVTRRRLLKFKETSLVSVWRVGQTQAAAHHLKTGGVYWMGFATPDELVVKSCDETHMRIQVWSLAKGKLLRQFPLSEELFPPPPNKEARLNYFPEPPSGAVSPGGRYLALGGPSGITVFSLADGSVAGTLPVKSKRIFYRGLRFSADGTELSAVIHWEPVERVTSVRLRSWKMADGKPVIDVELANKNANGPPLPGPDPGTVFLSYGRFDGNKYIGTGLVIDTRTGKTLRETPYTAVRWLADGRLLAVGPIKDAPPKTPLPSSLGQPVLTAKEPERRAREAQVWEENHRKDPTVRAVYPVTVPRNK